MADIDMIPRAYRDGVRVRRTLRLTGIALALVIAAGALGGIGLRLRTAALERSAAALQSAATRAQADSTRDAAQQAERGRRAQEHAVLRALRRQGELAALAHGLDAALGDDVWLTELRVERDIQALPAAGPAAPDASAEDFGAAVDTAAVDTAAAGAGAQTWRLRSTLALSGQAVSYEAVTAFLSALGRQPGIAAVRLLGSSAAADGRTIDFRATGALLHKGNTP